MGMMLHRHSGVDEQSAPEIVIKKVEPAKEEVKTEENNSKYYSERPADAVHRGRKRNN